MKRFYRSKENKLIFGLCAGLGRYFNIDPILWRILFVALALASLGLCFLLYIIAALMTPME